MRVVFPQFRQVSILNTTVIKFQLLNSPLKYLRKLGNPYKVTYAKFT